MSRYAYGCNPDRADHRDHEFLPAVARQHLPAQVSLNVAAIPVLDQGQQGSCTGHGTAGVVMFDQQKQGEPIVIPSRAMIYYDARIPEGSTGTDSGAQVRDAVAGVARYGACTDAEFPYDDQVCDVAPSAANYAEGRLQEAIVYERVRYGHLHQTLASGFPFVFGFTVYESFESAAVAASGIVPIPEPGESVIGGHCVWATGYNSSYTQTVDAMPPRTVRCRNSWGSSWGCGGDFVLPQWFFDERQASDYWVVRRIGAGT